jgi:hypothetical protein
MGTNFYLLQNVCTQCHKPDEVLHIGKRSFGWCFTFQGFENIKTTDEWKRLMQIPNSIIEDEYHHAHTFDDFWKMVDNLKDGRVNTYDSFQDNHGYWFHSEDFS